MATAVTETCDTVVFRLRQQNDCQRWQIAYEGGTVASNTRRDIEKRSGKPVVTGENFNELTGFEQAKIKMKLK